jgi:hypothetical protein
MPSSLSLAFRRWLQDRQERVSYVVIALGSNVHIFARPHRRAELAVCFETVLRMICPELSGQRICG